MRLHVSPQRVASVCGLVLLVFFVPAVVLGQLQRINKVGDFSGSGTVVDLQPGEIVIADESGKQEAFIIQDADERAISLDGNDYIISMPCKISVYGTMDAKLLEKGMYTEFRSTVGRFGKTKDSKPIERFSVIPGDEDTLDLEVPSSPEGSSYSECRVVGRVIHCRNGKVYLAVPQSGAYARQGRITFPVSDSASFEMTGNNLNRIKRGDKVVTFKGDKMGNGAKVIREIEIEMTAKREVATLSFADQLELKHSAKSDKPGKARTERSKNFILHTDLSDRSAAVLLAKLERLHTTAFRMLGKRPQTPIECYVVRDLNNFSGRIEAVGAKKIAEEAGVTASSRYGILQGGKMKGKRTVSVVYSCADHGVAQHEAIHAFCAMGFGTTGPVWYAEGMAELGQYWKPDNPEVEIDGPVIEYLTSANKKKLDDIVKPGQITGDSWKAYAWRWALCHLLQNNPNYSKRFKKLGANLMMEKNDSFDKAFGAVSKQIAFEYDQFVQNLDNGYRVDLCAWDWETKANPLNGKKPVSLLVSASRGWQATGVETKKGSRYDVLAKGNWKISEGTDALTADGRTTGKGKLVGAILDGYELSEPFELGEKSRFKAPENGHLYVRCNDNWSRLSDNSGELKVYVRKSPK